ncbi:MAG: hypothetical protein JJU45_18090 [Acidimicrobiia bacterium]|nr:hypothetical protein [Acidimicrobiia bacterium]
MSSVLAAGPEAIASHRAAAQLWEIGGRRAAPVELTIPRGRRHRPRGAVVHEARDLDFAEPCLRSAIPTTGLARTILDLGAVAPEQVRGAIRSARRNHELEWSDLLDTLAVHSRRGRPGLGVLRRLVAAHYGEMAGDSATEDHAFTLLWSSSLVPTPERHVPVLCADGVTVTADLGWPRWRAYVEVQGVDHFTNEDLQHTDLHRRNQLHLAGHNVLYVSGRQLRSDPSRFLADVEALLRRAGWRPGAF